MPRAELGRNPQRDPKGGAGRAAAVPWEGIWSMVSVLLQCLLDDTSLSTFSPQLLYLSSEIITPTTEGHCEHWRRTPLPGSAREY